ncbi:unnamed protein product [Lymnaea stagnalis]|uniref:Cytochrome P450 n=1 Tax=Lymnaea stagnalis TaxID=6523 RepID=A0AAV2H870_LYMST
MDVQRAQDVSEAIIDVSNSLMVIATVLFVYCIYTQLASRETWDKYGVKQVTMGRHALTDFRKALSELILEHGDTVGVTRGVMTLITRDLHLIREILTKDFHNFVDRIELMTTRTPLQHGVFFIKGKDWKRIRKVISPSFSTGKLKHTIHDISESAEKLGQILEGYARTSNLVPVKRLTGQYTSEIIASSAFGIATDSLGTEDDDFSRYAQEIFKTRSSFMNFVMLLMFRFKWLHNILVKKLHIEALDQVSEDAVKYFTSVLEPVVLEREELERSGKDRPKDFLQILISAKLSDALNPGNEFVVSENELIGQCLLIVFASFETTATTLQMCLYLLAKHPDIQEMVYSEMQSLIPSESPSYQELGQLKYMDQVIKETLRLHPPVPIVSRKSVHTATYGNVTIPGGSNVLIPVDMVMMDPENYPDPYKFDPDRFSEENTATQDPMAFIPFGAGPRQCLGMRLAYLELKLGLFHVLRKVKLEVNDHTEPKLGCDIAVHFQGILVLEKPILLAATLRNKD